MKIARADVIVTCPGRNFVTLKIVTDEDVYGIGSATAMWDRTIAVNLKSTYLLSPRSSNPPCRSPAMGSGTRHHAFVHGKSLPRPL